ncbi:ArsR/SmtB family transcription factor [Modicisalibacter zincidurans]|uniref:Helix-turn-helix transcriptional regulator n=1 Tax=Modicisalibacter zincidurans TaxID=1178777 RepID=A0ABP9RD67_9GAMM|nr:metalloregulator ArsR/SmtB family transcription factor [Halomonas zincidurans]
MDNIIAIEAFAALSQSTRLETFRLLVRHEPDGLPAGEIARLLDVPHNTLSTHLGVLARAGLVVSRRHSRSVIYSASLERMRETLSFLVRDCCAGHPELCEPLLRELQPCCPTDEGDSA